MIQCIPTLNPLRLICLGLFAVPLLAAVEQIDISAYQAMSDGGRDWTPSVRSALDHCRADQAVRKLIFPKGRYDFFPERASEQYLLMSNNDEGYRRVAFPLQGVKDLEIDGQGSEFIFHGMIVPFVCDHSSKVAISNLSLDWDTSFHSEGDIVDSAEGVVTLHIPPQFPYKIVNGQYRHLGAGFEVWKLDNLLEWDVKLRETAFGVKDNYGAFDHFTFEPVVGAERQVRVHGPFAKPLPTPGNRLILAGFPRLCPAVLVSDTEGFRLSGVTIYHAGAMAVIAQRSADLIYDHLVVAPRPGGGRTISAIADATHFVSCRGQIELSHCRFECQKDDATNVHGVYTRISGFPDRHSVEAVFIHPQQFGRNPAEIGHRIQFTDHRTLAVKFEAVVTAVERINKERTILRFAEELPASIEIADSVLDLFWMPTNVSIHHCFLHGNRARGFLLSVAAPTLVEECDFHVPGAAIIIAGDANFWFESGPVNGVIIRRNRFTNNNYGVWGTAAIEIDPEIQAKFRGEPRYHRNISIVDNRFEVFYPELLKAHSVDGLTFTGNTVVPSTAYPAKGAERKRFDISDCSQVTITE